MERSDAQADFLRDLAAWEEAMQKKDIQLKNSVHTPFGQELPPRKFQSITINPAQFIADKKVLSGLESASSVPLAAQVSTTSSKPVELPKSKPTETPKPVSKNPPPPTTLPPHSHASQPPAKLSDSLRSQLEQDANDEKEKGNTAFKAGQYREAIARYSNALMITPSNSVLYSNRAMSYLKLQDWESAEKDCTSALALDPKNVKAFARRANARKSLNRYTDALKDVESGLELEPGNKELHDEARLLRSLANATSTTATTKPATTAPSSSSTPKKSPATELPSSSTQPANKPKISELSPANPSPAPSKPAAVAVKPSAPSASVQNKAAAATSLVSSPSGKKLASTSAAPARRLILKPTVPENAPQTSFEFEKEWHALRSDQSCLVQYWKMIDPMSYEKLFSSGFTPEVFSDVLAILKSSYLPNDIEGAFCVVKQLLSVDRIEVLIGFMSDIEKSTVRDVLSAAQSKGIQSDVSLLRTKYGV